MRDRQDIINKLKSYDPDFPEALVNKALDFAIKYHGTQKRDSGEMYFQHPLEVCGIVVDMKLDSASAITALLHDTVEDTDLTIDDIEHHFGAEVAKLVDGVTKLTKIEFQPDHVRQAENFRKLFLAMSNDIRVLLVKLADRLHNMRTLDFKSPEKRMRIAVETMEIYGPLAERIGMQETKLELQDLSFKIIHPQIRESILSRLNKLSENGEKLVDDIVSEIGKTLKKGGLDAKVSGRQKTPYSIWMKMKQKNVSFEQLSDIIAFRITVKTLPECYQALGLVHAAYKMVPESFQDFISTPKNNGYQSLHTLVVGPMQQRIEIQIRTEEMHEIAELGVAAHWRYKQKYDSASDGLQYRWVRELLNMLEQAKDPEEFLQHTKLAMYYDQVFCFTPKGTLIALPKGATPIDFAYAVHSDVGYHCVGSKVNGRMAPLRSVLENGDQVEIITSKNQFPSPSWEKFVITGKAKLEIRRFVRSQQRSQYIKLGQAILEKTFKAAEITYSTGIVEDIAHNMKKASAEDLLFAVGEGSISREDVLKEARPPESKISSTLSFFSFKKPKKLTTTKENAIPIHGLIPGMAVHFAGCCHALPGDQIVGVIHTGKGVTIHTSDCEMLNNFASTPDRILDLSWDSDSTNIPYICRLRVILANEPGSLAMLSSEIAKNDANITNLRVVSRNQDFFEFIFDIEVTGLDHLNTIISSLQTKEGVHSIERYKP
ncbi:MAG: bifunctional (p)ppGpp synthetase/guanosine-3',5'-bis(diphosphate) 3'-pyrophosphohydrolase [Rickettsiaceae bacterium]|nr:bifunctional (p)ppGpp synthetase/guanosine-3',5'-bis(diphosphate) 3'-pyrophosphohydrolase [Rickettsiaceae bacterium]